MIEGGFGFASFDCRKVIGFVLLRYTIGLKNSRHLFHPLEEKPKPIITRLHEFSRALRQLRVTTSSFDWFTVLSMSFVLASVFGFGFATLGLTRLITSLIT